MTNHDLLAFVYENGPCTHVDIDFEFGCGIPDVTFATCWLMLYGLLTYDIELGLFSYSGDEWI